MSRLSISGGVLAALLVAVTPAAVSAVTYDKLAYLTFNAPVQIPGVTLDAGTYRFRLANPDTSRNVLQVLSEDGSAVYAMFHTIPDSRSSLTEDPVVTFKETPAGVPPAVKTLFYGGEYDGYEFVYPKGGPIMIAAEVPQPQITYAAAPPAFVPEPIAEFEAQPAAEAEPVAEAVAEAAPLPEPAELPRTASPLPFMAVGGLTLLVSGLGLGLLRRRAN